GVDWEPEEYSPTRHWSEAPIPFMVARAKKPCDEVIRFLPDARGPVFLDCLHFSVATLATVGYGDVSPNHWVARASADCQIVLGVVLLVLVVRIFFSGWWGKFFSPTDVVFTASSFSISKVAIGAANVSPTAVFRPSLSVARDPDHVQVE